jgi:hypothetical protein
MSGVIFLIWDGVLLTLVAAAMYTLARIKNMYACTIPVNNPSAVITMGNIKGAINIIIAITMEPLIIFPNNRTANANVLDISPIILNGNIMTVGLA